MKDTSIALAAVPALCISLAAMREGIFPKPALLKVNSTL